MVRLSDLHKSFGEAAVLRGVNLEIRNNEAACLVGPSGAGKSTLLRCVNLLERPTAGSVFVGGVEITARNAPIDPIRSRIGMVFQDFRLFPHLTALENCALAPRTVLRRPMQEAREQARSVLARVGLRRKSESHPNQLSGGQQQRVAIARALCMDPILMLFDEPTSALDPELIGEVLAVIAELAETGMTMLVVTHEMGFASRAADRMLMLDRGEILADAPPETFFSAPEDARISRFLGRSDPASPPPSTATVLLNQRWGGTASAIPPRFASSPSRSSDYSL